MTPVKVSFDNISPGGGVVTHQLRTTGLVRGTVRCVCMHVCVHGLEKRTSDVAEESG